MSVRVVDNSAIAMQAARVGARKGVQAGVLMIETDAKLYAPVLTGHHRRSIASKVVEAGELPDLIYGVVGHQSDYGGFLERGTRHMAARPHFAPAFDKNEAAVRALIPKMAGEAIAAALPKVGA